MQVEKLTKAEFSEALFQLVDVWCEHVEAMELFAEFLKTVFQSITSFDRQDKCHRYKPMNQIRSLHDILEDIRSVTLQQHEMDEATREQRRGELHASRGVRRAGGARTRGSVVRSSLLISTVLGNKSQGLQGSTTLETDGSSTGGGDLRDAKDSLRALRTKTKAVAGLALACDGNEKRRYTTKADWERFGVVEGGAVMVKAPRSRRDGPNFTGAKGRVGAEAVAGGEEAAWQQGTVTAVTRKRVSVAYGGGGKITFEASDPAACTSLCGFAVEHAPLAGKGDWAPLDWEVANRILNAVETKEAITFQWSALGARKGGKTYEVDATRMPGKSAEPLDHWTGEQRLSGADAGPPANAPKRARQAEEDKDAGVYKLRTVRVPPASAASHAATQDETYWRSYRPQPTPPSGLVREAGEGLDPAYMAEVRAMRLLLQEVERRLAADKRVPEVIADEQMELSQTPAAEGVYGGAAIVPREYTAKEVKNDIRRLQQHGSAWARCDLLRPKTRLVSQLRAHLQLLSSLWAHVDGETTVDPELAMRWYVGSESKERRPVTGMAERLRGGAPRASPLSFTALLPRETESRGRPSMMTPSLPRLVEALARQQEDRRPMQLPPQEVAPSWHSGTNVLRSSVKSSASGGGGERLSKSPYRLRHGGSGVGGSIVRSRGRSPTVQRSTLYRVPAPTPLQ